MINSNPRAAPRHPLQPSNSTRPPDPFHPNKAHMSTIANENGSETTVWHYRLTKHHVKHQPRTSPQDMLIELTDTFSNSGNHFFLIHQNTDKITAVTSQEIAESHEISNFVSSYTNIPKASSTSLLIHIASNQANLQHIERPIDDHACSFTGRWTIHPNRFQGGKSCMIGIFSNIIHEGVSWDKSSAMITQEVQHRLTRPDKPCIETRPVKFDCNEEGSEKSATYVAVYAAVDYIAKVKGICMRLAFEKIALCAAASISPYIRCTNGGASTDNAETQPTPAEEAREASADNQVVAQPSPTDVEMNEYYNKCSASRPTETNNISTLVQLKKSKNVSTNTGQATTKAAQKKS